MAEADFSVTPEVLIQKADDMEIAIEALKEDYDVLKGIIEGTAGYWFGEGGDSCRRMFIDRQNEMEEMLNRMRDHPAKILEIAGIFKKTETDITQNTTKLPTDPFGDMESSTFGNGGGRF